jgi:hypothetical protein
VELYSNIIHNYRFFSYLANEMAYLAQREANREDAVALDEYRYSIVSVIFSFTYVEGFVSHLMYAPNSPIQDSFSSMSEKKKQKLERKSLPKRIEYLATHPPSSKTANLDRNRELYRSFILLTDLRHFLIHYKPKEEVTLSSEKDYRKAFENLENRARGNFDFNERMPEEGFLYRCYSADCARWAFKVSGEVIDWLCDTLSIEKPVRHTPWPLGGDSH